MNNSVFGKGMGNVKKHSDIKLVTTDNRRNQLVSKPNFHTAQWSSEDFVSHGNLKNKVKNK